MDKQLGGFSLYRTSNTAGEEKSAVKAGAEAVVSFSILPLTLVETQGWSETWEQVTIEWFSFRKDTHETLLQGSETLDDAAERPREQAKVEEGREMRL